MGVLRALAVAILILTSSAACQDSGQASARVEEGGWKSLEIEEVRLAWLEMEDSYRFTVTAPTTGWVSVGFGGGPAMQDANMIIGYAEEGEAHIRDDHGTSPVTHSPDTDLGGTSDLTEYSVIESEGETEMSFVVPMEPGDGLDGAFTPGETLRVIVAFGSGDDFTSMHRAAHSSEMTL
jgi:hypothetical protein